MADLLRSERTYVSRLRVRGATLDPLVTQLRVENLLSATRLHPTGLPPSAILCVRRLRARLSGSLQLRHAGTTTPEAWQQAVTSKLDQLVRRAARPALGPLRTDADAVIFEDRAQLLACMASDWCEGTFHTRWWWQSLFKEAAVAQSFLRAWLDAPEYIPSALEHLSRDGKAETFIRALSADDALSLLQRVTRSFALDTLRPALAALLNRQADATSNTIQAAAVLSLPRTEAQSPAGSQAAKAPPWQRYLPESPLKGIHLEAQCLLGISLMLARSPAIVRSLSFARDLKRWLEATTRAPLNAATDSHSAGADHTHVLSHAVAAQTLAASRQEQSEPSSAEETAQAREDEMEADAKALSTADAGQRSSGKQQHDAPASQWRGDAASQSDAKPRGTKTIQVKESEGESASAVPSSADKRELRQPTEDVERVAIREQVLHAPVEHDGPTSTEGASVRFDETPDEAEPIIPEPLLEARLETEFGGVFYLVNVGLFLNLYGDFTMPAHKGIALSLWDFVALLGERLCGAKVRADKVWTLLARLAGHTEQVEPGRDFAPPLEWRLPVEWLEPFAGERVFRWTVDDERLRVRHSQGFLILDLPLGGSDPARQLELEMKAYESHAPFELRRGEWSIKDDAREPLERWLRWLTAYVQARLARALGLEGASLLSKLLFEHTARVFVTATHVDIVFELAQLPVEVRLSGLDRNPGWVPAAGRFIAFHYN